MSFVGHAAAPTKQLVFTLASRPGWTEITTSKASDVLARVPGAELVGASDDGPVLHVPHNQAVAEILADVQAPHLPPMVTDYDWKASFTPMPHQFRVAGSMSTHKRFFCLAEPGCVDGSTEYLSRTGWKRIDQYDGGEVMQYHADTGVGEFVQPISYIAKPCDVMIHFKTTRGMDMMLSPEHRVLWHHPETNEAKVSSAGEIALLHRQLKQGFKGRIPAAFQLKESTRLELTDAQLRVMVAVIADAYFQSPAPSVRATVRVKKERKKARMRELLASAGIPFLEKSRDFASAKGYTLFTFDAPIRAKDYSGFWEAAPSQLAIVVDEMKYWDGSTRVGNRAPAFSTRVAASADFVQYAHAALGQRTTISAHTRDTTKVVDGKTYHDTGTDMDVIPSSGGAFVTMSNSTSVECKDANVTEVPAPGGMKYCFEVPSSFLVLRRNGKIFCTGNTGKTVCSVWAFDYLKRIGRAKRALIIAPLSLLEDTWLKEFKNAAPHLSCAVLYGTAAKRKKIAAMPHDVHIINYDGIEIVYDQLMANKYDVVVLDESTNIKNINRRWKFCNAVAKPAEWVWLLTGTPTAQSPTDAYGQCKLLLGEKFQYSEGGWKDATMQQMSKFRWVPKKESAQLVQHWMQPAIFIKKRDVMPDMPPIMKSRRRVELSPAQKTMLDDLKKAAMASTDHGATITAVHAAALNLKICQVSSGAVYDDNRDVVELDNTPRIAELVEVIRDTRARDDNVLVANNKVLVFCMFKHTVATVVNALKANGIDAVAVTGDTSAGQRTAIFGAFQSSKQYEVIVAVPDVMAHGLTLTAASTTVWFTPHTRAELYQQANNRTDRPGQKYSMEIVELYGCQAEKVLYDRLDERGQHQQDVLAAYAELVRSM